MTPLEHLINTAFYEKVRTTIVSTVTNTEKGPMILPQFNLEKGVIYNIPEASLDFIKAKANPYANRIEPTISNLFNVHTINTSNMELAQILKICINLLTDTNVYGIIYFPDKEPPINIGHFMSPLIRHTNQLPNSHTSKLAIYSYKVQISNRDLDSEAIKNEISLIATIETALLNTYPHKIKKDSGVTLEGLMHEVWKVDKPKSRALYARLTYASTTVLPATETNTHALVPLYFLTKGIICPFYGVSYIKFINNDVIGGDITSCISANISDNGSVCVGSMSRLEYDSYRSLNYSNIDSAFRSSSIPNNYPSIAEAHKQYTILKLKGVIDELAKEQIPF